MLKKIFSGVLALVLVSSMLCACAKKEETAVTSDTFLLDYYDGSDTSNGYDTELLYNNDSYVWGADSGVIYVPEERDEEYGGWFYQYLSATGRNQTSATFVWEDGKTYREAVALLRSRDLVDWEICGTVDTHFCLLLEEDSWAYSNFYAPEVIYDEKSDKYYMYFSARTPDLTEERLAQGAKYKNVFDAKGNRHYNSEFYCGIAVSDTPVGPFRLVTSENVYGNAEATNPLGEVLTSINPPIMWDQAYNMTEEWPIIDFHPYFDENGDFYLFFVKHVSLTATESGDPLQQGNQLWGVKMLDMVTPDYKTITKLVGNEHIVTIKYKGAKQDKWDDRYPRYLTSSYEHTNIFPNGEQNLSEGDWGCVEAPQLTVTKDSEGNKVYLLSYSVRGVTVPNYDVHYAYSYSILGPYTKAAQKEGDSLIQYDVNNDFESNLGHHQFVTVGDETVFVYSGVPVGMNTAPYGRAYAVDSVGWQWRSMNQADGKKIDILVPVANGPTRTLQPKFKMASGYYNVAKDAKITVSSGEGTQYLNDGVIATTQFMSEDEFFTEQKDVTITLTFDQPKSIRGILLYNSYEYFRAFGSVDTIQFELAKTPACYTKGEAKYCIIKDLKIDQWTVNEDGKIMRPGGGAVATFDEIEVKSITIKISDVINKELAEGLGLSEIYVIGK